MSDYEQELIQEAHAEIMWERKCRQDQYEEWDGPEMEFDEWVELVESTFTTENSKG